MSAYFGPWCHNCRKRFSPRGIAGHRMAHLRRGEEVTVTLKSGTWIYRPKSD